MVQNMSAFVCPNCAHTTHIFGADGVADMARRMAVPVLGDVPLDLAIRCGSDAGTPVTACDPTSPHAMVFKDIAQRVWDRILEVHAVAHEEAPTDV